MIFAIPTAWLQLQHKKTRLLVAVLGIVFAVVIIFMQLGIRDALFDSAVRLHKSLDGDCFLISPRSTSLIAMESFSERRLLQALALEEVEQVSPVYLGYAQWKNPKTKNYWRNIFVIGIDLRHQVSQAVGIQENLAKLRISDTVLFDRNSRAEFGPIAADFAENGKVITEVGNQGNNRKIEVVGLFELGTSFGSDGNLLMSHSNFLHIFQLRRLGFIDIGVIKLKTGYNAELIRQKLKNYLPPDVKVLAKPDFIYFEKNYWQTSTAIGFIFNLGVFLGLVVGLVVVYQILYTNVTEHLREYATLKAMGYKDRYFLSIVLQQSLVMAILGYLPGFLFSLIQYSLTKKITLLPISMSLERSLFVFFLTLGISFISGTIALDKLKQADPADIF
jgi:putative ABC transport system permease protein